MNTARITYWTTENFVCGIFSSRPGIPCYDLSPQRQQIRIPFSFGWGPSLEYRKSVTSAVRQRPQGSYGRITWPARKPTLALLEFVKVTIDAQAGTPAGWRTSLVFWNGLVFSELCATGWSRRRYTSCRRRSCQWDAEREDTIDLSKRRQAWI